MTENEFLEGQSERVRERLRRRASALSGALERAIAPAVREHPRTGLAVGAATGFLLGRSAASIGPAGGALAGLLGFLKNTGIHALRSLLVTPLFSGGEGESS